MTLTLDTQTRLTEHKLAHGMEMDAFDFDLETLAEKALTAQIAFDNAKTVAESTKAAFRKALDAQGKLNPDFKGTSLVRTVIKTPNKFDPKKALELLNAEEIAQYSAISGALVKANVAPTVYALMQSPSTTSLELKLAD